MLLNDLCRRPCRPAHPDGAAQDNAVIGLEVVLEGLRTRACAHEREHDLEEHHVHSRLYLLYLAFQGAGDALGEILVVAGVGVEQDEGVHAG